MKPKKDELLRKGDLVLHCVEVKVFQNADNGVLIKGHGIIKVNKVGTLYMELIATESENIPHTFFNERLPRDPDDDSQTLYMVAKTINGEVYESKGFSLEVNLNSAQVPSLYYLFLSSIECCSQVGPGRITDGNYLYFEFAENFSIPSNKSNSVISTLGEESHSWNQTLIEVDGFEVSMVKKDGYTDVRVTGDFDIEEVRSCLKFYIGFTSGSMPQLVLMVEIKGDDKVETISSVSSSQKRQTSVSPIIPNAATGKSMDPEYHYSLFRKIVWLYREHPKRFESIYAQWRRVWYSFQSQNSIMSLTLSVAIEGLLNDIFIPEIKLQLDTRELEAEIAKVKAQLKALEIDQQQLSRLMNSVGHWTSITASKAMDYLIDYQVITKEDKKNWTYLRNASAHPKMKDSDSAKERLEKEKVLSCLNTFHKLILNALAYSGPVDIFGADGKHHLVELKHREIFHTKPRLP